MGPRGADGCWAHAKGTAKTAASVRPIVKLRVVGFMPVLPMLIQVAVCAGIGITTLPLRLI
jgi:hypothetical protein